VDPLFVTNIAQNSRIPAQSYNFFLKAEFLRPQSLISSAHGKAINNEKSTAIGNHPAISS
jgi:hypothetical protein